MGLGFRVEGLGFRVWVERTGFWNFDAEFFFMVVYRQGLKGSMLNQPRNYQGRYVTSNKIHFIGFRLSVCFAGVGWALGVQWFQV